MTKGQTSLAPRCQVYWNIFCVSFMYICDVLNNKYTVYLSVYSVTPLYREVMTLHLSEHLLGTLSP